MTRIAVVQYQIECLNSFEAYKNKIITIVEKVKKEAAELVLFSEYAGIEVGGYHKTDQQLFFALQKEIPAYCDFFKKLASDYQLYIQPGSIPIKDGDHYFNRAFFFAKNGQFYFQDKLQLTQYEKNSGLVKSGHAQHVFDTSIGKIGIAICYDSEFPEIVRNLVLNGACLILVPSYTVDEAGFNRVTVSCRARAIENQCYVAAAFTVGEVHVSEPPEKTQGYSGVFGPIETKLSSDGIITQTRKTTSDIIFADILMDKIKFARSQGDVQNFNDFESLQLGKISLINFKN